MYEPPRTCPTGTNCSAPAGYSIVRAEGRYFPVRLHLHDTTHPGTTAFTHANGMVASFAKRISALVSLYRQQEQSSV
ncbi:MAG TPA: hypothetical protein VFN35_17630 [Ktedonobacteraceae bacterium]|nr:hypothetical protein [Ktedonobacteraceae bacterium]